jgi:dihydrofolate reductase
VPAGVRFVTEPIAAFAQRLRTHGGKNVWMMGGGNIIGAFLHEDAIDEFIITIVPTFIGNGIDRAAPSCGAAVPALRAPACSQPPIRI